MTDPKANEPRGWFACIRAAAAAAALSATAPTAQADDGPGIEQRTGLMDAPVIKQRLEALGFSGVRVGTLTAEQPTAAIRSRFEGANVRLLLDRATGGIRIADAPAGLASELRASLPTPTINDASVTLLDRPELTETIPTGPELGGHGGRSGIEPGSTSGVDGFQVPPIDPDSLSR